MIAQLSKPSLTLIILAAGLGSRYGGVKQLEIVGPQNTSILDYSIFDAIHAGFNHIVLVIQPNMYDVFLKKISEKKYACQFSFIFQTVEPSIFTSTSLQRSKPWGTGHAVLATQNVVKTPFAVINADDFYGAQSFSIMADYLRGIDSNSHNFAMLGFQLAKTLSENGAVSRGVCNVIQNQLQSIQEYTKIQNVNDFNLNHNTIVSMNFWGFTPILFPYLLNSWRAFLKGCNSSLTDEFYLTTCIQQLIEQQKIQVNVLETPETWFGITFPDDKPKVESMIQKLITAKIYPLII